MPVGATIAAATATAGASVYSASKQAKAAKDSAKTVANSTDKATDLQREQFDRTLKLQQPGYRVGQSALGLYSTALGMPGFDLIGGSGDSTYGLTPAEIAAQKAQYGSPTAIADQVRSQPGYQTQLAEGLKAYQTSAAARGSLRSGRTAAGLEQYGQRTFGGYYDKWLAGVGSLAGLQGAAANNIGAAGQTTANNIGNLGVQGAQSTAAGNISAANAWADGLGGVAGSLSAIPWGSIGGGSGGTNKITQKTGVKQ